MEQATDTLIAEVAAPSASQNALTEVRKQVVAIDRVQAGIDDLRQRFGGVVFDVTTTKGMDEAKRARMEIREPRFAVGRALQAAKRPLNDLKKAIEERASEITAQLQAIEDPIHDQITAEEARKEAEKAARRQAELERVARLEVRVEKIRAYPADLIDSPASTLAEAMTALQALDLSEEAWDEFQPRAIRARDEVLTTLRTMHLKAEAREAEAAELARQRAELEAQAAALRAQQEAQALLEAEARAAQEAKEAEARAELERQEAAARAERERLDAEAAAARRKADVEAAAARAAEQARLDAEASALRRQREEQERVEREARAAAEAQERAAREEAERIEREAKAAAEAQARAEREEAERLEALRQAADLRVRDAAHDLLEALQRVIAWDDEAKALPPEVLLPAENAIHIATWSQQ